MNATCCPKCDGRLTQNEVSNGWCDNCGKKLPVWMQTRETGQAQGACPTTAGVPAPAEKMTAGQMVLLVLFVLAMVGLVAGACAGDKTCIRGVAKLGVILVVGLVFGGVAALVRLVRKGV